MSSWGYCLWLVDIQCNLEKEKKTDFSLLSWSYLFSSVFCSVALCMYYLPQNSLGTCENICVHLDILYVCMHVFKFSLSNNSHVSLFILFLESSESEKVSICRSFSDSWEMKKNTWLNNRENCRILTETSTVRNLTKQLWTLVLSIVEK